MLSQGDMITLTGSIVSSYVEDNKLDASELPSLLTNVFNALNAMGQTSAATPINPERPITVRASVKPDYLVCLEDGAKVILLKPYDEALPADT